MIVRMLYSFVRSCLRIFFEEFVQKYPATGFSGGAYNIPASRTALTALDTSLLEILRNRHLGERCFIIGNGPSLTAQDLDMLRFEYTFASNKIYLLFNATSWRPTYYSCEDTLVIEQNEQEIMGLESTLKIFPNHILNHVQRRPGCYFVDFINNIGLLKNLPSEERNFSYDLLKGVHWGSTITYTLIQMAVFMGFKDIYLLGIDHSYVTPKKKKGNFYISEGERNHFSKEYRKAGEKWHEPRMDVLECSYKYARLACEEAGVSVYNASRRTALDVFEKVDLDLILGIKFTDRL